MKKLCLLIQLSCALLTLSACKLSLITDVHMTQLHQVAFNEAADITTATTIEIQIPSKIECDEYSIKYIEFIEEFVSDAAHRGCLKKGSEIYLLIEVQTPIVFGPEAWEETDALFGVMLVNTDEHVNVFMMSNLDRYEVLEKKMQSEFDQASDLSNLHIWVFLNNFRRHEILSVRGIFLNNEPIDNYEEIKYRRRQRLGIELSNVGVAYLESKGHAFAFAFKK